MTLEYVVWPVLGRGFLRPRSLEREAAHRADADIAGDGIAIHLHLGWKPSVHRIETQQVSVGLDRAEIVDRDEEE